MIFGLGFVSACVAIGAMFWFGERVARFVYQPTDVDMDVLDGLVAAYGY